jgi:hypothetical protein
MVGSPNAATVVGDEVAIRQELPAAGARPVAFGDLERIFGDIVDTAITRAASIPCFVDDYRHGLELMVTRLNMTIRSLPRYDR